MSAPGENARLRSWHRALGLVLALPLCAWAATGLLFHLKPGWGAAYSSLALPFLPLEEGAAEPAMPAEAGWLETRRLRTELGEHLLVRTSSGWRNLDARTLAPFPMPDEAQLAALVDGALEDGRERYGHVTGRADGAFVTDTGVRIELDWDTLALAQSGPDTRCIDLLYRIHYLQWTGIPAVDRPLALCGLVALVALTLAGLRLAGLRLSRERRGRKPESSAAPEFRARR